MHQKMLQATCEIIQFLRQNAQYHESFFGFSQKNSDIEHFRFFKKHIKHQIDLVCNHRAHVSVHNGKFKILYASNNISPDAQNNLQHLIDTFHILYAQYCDHDLRQVESEYIQFCQKNAELSSHQQYYLLQACQILALSIRKPVLHDQQFILRLTNRILALEILQQDDFKDIKKTQLAFIKEYLHDIYNQWALEAKATIPSELHAVYTHDNLDDPKLNESPLKTTN